MKPISTCCWPLVLGALLGACGSGGDSLESSARDLLQHAPALVLEVPGPVLPDAEEGWLGRRSSGWNTVTSKQEGRPLSVHSSQALAELTVSATEPTHRTIEFTAWRALGAEPAGVDVLLNGVALGRVELGREPATHTVESPKEAWLLGENELGFALDPAALVVGADELPHGIALAELNYGAAQRVAPLDVGFRLDAGTGLRYRLEERAASQLTARGVAAGAGALEVRTRRLAPSTLLALDEGAGAPVVADMPAGPGEVSLTLPAAGGALLEVELLWHSPAGATFELTGLELEEAVAVKPPSIVLISIDTLAAGHTSLFDFGRTTSPELEAFAKDATVFEQCLTNAPWTMPSYAALMSGYFPSSARFSPNLTSTHFAFTFPDARWTLAEALSAAGYQTGAFVDSPNVGARLGFDQGFDVFDESARDVPHGDPQGGLVASSQAAFEWLDGLDPGSPYFLFLHANDVHGPYVPKAEARGKFRDGEPGRELFAGALTGTFDQVPEYLLGSALGDFDPAAERLPAKPFADAYDESILSMDQVLGSVLERLRARGALDNALVIFTADHGEAFDEHDLFGHGLLYQEVLHVPLVISLPKSQRAGGMPRHIAQPVQLVDLYPTLIELAGLQSDRSDLHGRSLLPLLDGRDVPLAPTYSEGGIMRQSAVVFDRWKLVETWPGEDAMPWTMLTYPGLDPTWLDEHAPEVAGGALDTDRVTRIGMRVGDLNGFLDDLRDQLPGPVLELFDLDADPLELTNLATSRPDIRAELLGYMRAARDKIDAARLHATESRVHFNADELRDLEALGY